ncbi:L-ascorbate metabolism protein UlaG, beta-lactamase superfamily [Mucilaginibacter sp. OK268]|jgi:L-ascorbate metabolism protein UlaG (beta-lactamase superfamily)|uniref:MBL fold metallo-hydrolase n=1 Tax=Mucilaginibacter sp. OK268 TaxID=1881048 RepID=UPI00088029EE|nr:MBL fold metallo-hydrolase [Mucilaginibacter sp. OK268]SDP92888.1 L-ascorbate metabolism protein UlaG, beta-lactamase superfamily [Mucilaginibacter sp. OK268]
MKISKYLHSCLVFELDGYKILFDPGDYSFIEGLVTPQMFADVNIIVITHIHPDHFVIDILQKIMDVSDAQVLTNSQVGEQLQKAGIEFSILEDATEHFGPFKLQAFPVQHALIMDNPLPQMTGFIINDKVLHPVDSMEDKLLKFKDLELLIMVTMAPFASEVMISAFADRLNPRQILPVHDGYAKTFFIQKRYAAYAKHFDKLGIKFHEVYQVGDSITI